MMFTFILYSVLNSMFVLANMCTSSVSDFLTAPYTSWFPVVSLAVLAFLVVLIVVYMLSPLVGRTDIRSWTKIKGYELLLSLVLIGIFASFSTEICVIDPKPYLIQVQILPSSCNNNNINNLYAVSICDMSQFNSYMNYMNTFLYYVLLTFAIQPAFGVSVSIGGTAQGTVLGGTGGVGVSVSHIELTPAQASIKYLGPVLDGLYTLVLINKMQLLLLSSSLVIFSIFMAIGLIARAFGVGRTFGGAMIAFALGIGFVYPLVATINYGFLDYGLQNSIAQSAGSLYPALLLTPVITVLSLLASYPNIAPFLSYIPEYVFEFAGLISMGMLFVPLINFVILDTFIIDFSTAIGERMDFMSLLTRIL